MREQPRFPKNMLRVSDCREAGSHSCRAVVLWPVQEERGGPLAQGAAAPPVTILNGSGNLLQPHTTVVPSHGQSLHPRR